MVKPLKPFAIWAPIFVRRDQNVGPWILEFAKSPNVWNVAILKTTQTRVGGYPEEKGSMNDSKWHQNIKWHPILLAMMSCSACPQMVLKTRQTFSVWTGRHKQFLFWLLWREWAFSFIFTVFILHPTGSGSTWNSYRFRKSHRWKRSCSIANTSQMQDL